MRNSFGLIGVACALLQGCAGLTTYQASLGDPSTGVSMDAQQRMLLVNPDPKKVNARRMCAEPSPDVMSAIGASMSGSLFGSGSASKALSAALSQNVQNIGLRTQSIQLMRDMMYRVCEGYLNYAYDDEDYMSLQTQAQGLIVGLLAIEQLTGAVKSDQGSISTSASSGALPNADEQADRLVEAEAAQLEKTQDVKDAQAALKKASDALQANKDAISAAGAADTTKLKQEQPALTDEVEKTKREYDLQRDQLKTANTRLSAAQEAYSRARSAVTAATKGRGEFSSSTRTYNWSAEAVKEVGSNVEKIVARVISRSEFERCFQLRRDPGNLLAAQIDAFCAQAKQLDLAKAAAKMKAKGVDDTTIFLMTAGVDNPADAQRLLGLRNQEIQMKLQSLTPAAPNGAVQPGGAR